MRLGDMAAHLLDDELVQAVLKRMEQDYLRQWRETDRNDTESRERLFMAVQTIDVFKEHLKIIADNGKFDRVQIEKAREKAGVSNQRKSE